MRRVLSLALLWGCSAETTESDLGPPNVLLISLDTVRADHMGSYGHSRNTTPFLDMIAQRGVVFENSYSASNESAYSHTALFTGRFASEVTAPVYQAFTVPKGEVEGGPDALFISELLQEQGYETSAFIAGGHVSDDFGFDQGFDHFSSEDGFAMFWHTVPKALEWLDARDGSVPWFMVLHGYDGHRPYVSPAPFYGLFTESPDSATVTELVRNGKASEQVYDGVYYPDARIDWFDHVSGSRVMDPDSYSQLATVDSVLEASTAVSLSAAEIDAIQAHYDTMLAYADLQLGLFLADAERQGKLDNTVVLITGDHGEDLLDHEFMNHRTSLYDSSVKVPMIAWGPGFAEGQRIEGLVSAIDVVPTILELTGQEPLEGLQGRSLRALAAGEVSAPEAVYVEGVLNQLAIRTETHKLVVTNQELLDPKLPETLAAAPIMPIDFTLVDLVADPGERVNLLMKPTEADRLLADQLRGQLVSWRKGVRIRKSWTSVESSSLDMESLSPDTIQRMQDAGYWESDED